MESFVYSSTRTLICKPGAASDVGQHAEQLGITRALLVSDRSVAKLGLADGCLASLKESGIDATVFTDVVPDPPESVVMSALKMATASGADGVVGFGGGSSMDVAKVVSLLARSGENLAQVYGVGNARGDRLPLIQVPTTAGTGSEVTPIAIITTGETTKQGVVATQLLPDFAILDASLTIGLPGFPTATTGIDAMVHAIEAYTSKHKKNPYSDMLAREALRLLSSNVVAVVEDGKDIEARSAMLLGASLAGQAFANAPVAAIHALAYPLGGYYHIAHGLTNALVLPHVLRFNAPAAELLYTEPSAILVPDATPGSEALIRRLQDLIAECRLPARLRDVEVPEDDLPMLARDSMKHQRLLVNNPRELGEDDALEIYRRAY